MAEQPPPVTITERAAERLKALIAAEGRSPDELAFRVGVQGGGCAGFSYQFDLVEKGEPDDIETVQHGVRVLVDGLSLLYLLGSRIDFVEDLIGASFRVTNPNAQSSCGCGTSFSLA
ncbi:MAG: heme biosynthesis protein HemY [Rhodothalassiaceae bacterium]|nr:MAG: heme biosynthesis protein HemY [Rhodothalassiaceae bacterium]